MNNGTTKGHEIKSRTKITQKRCFYFQGLQYVIFNWSCVCVGGTEIRIVSIIGIPARFRIDDN